MFLFKKNQLYQKVWNIQNYLGMLYTKVCILFLIDFENDMFRNEYFDDTDCKNALKKPAYFRSYDLSKNDDNQRATA